MMSWLASSPLLASLAWSANWMLCLMVVLMGTLIADVFALGFLGLWLGLNAKKSWVPAFAALGRIVLLPVAVFMTVMMLLGWATRLRAGPGPAVMVWLWALVGGVNSLIFCARAYSNLHVRFRAVAAGDWSAATIAPLREQMTEPEPGPVMEEYFSLFKK
jgi:hypothetical protein